MPVPVSATDHLRSRFVRNSPAMAAESHTAFKLTQTVSSDARTAPMSCSVAHSQLSSVELTSPLPSAYAVLLGGPSAGAV